MLVKVCLILHVGPTGNQNHIRDHFQTHFNANPMAILELANELPFKIIFFEAVLELANGLREVSVS